MKLNLALYAALLSAALLLLAAPTPSHAQDDSCQGYGPQTPRDISDTAGENPVTFSVAPAAAQMNLCNIHFHRNAEHKGPGYSEFAGEGDFGGYRCNDSGDPDTGAETVCENVHVGDSVEVHWVFTTCDVEPGEGLGACLSDACANPQLRVEAQVFRVVAGGEGGDFGRYLPSPEPVDGFHQPQEVPTGTGEPVVFLGSTTGPSYDAASKCSPLQVTWSVRPECAPLSAESLGAWCEDNPFAETKAQGVRALVTDPRLLSPIR